jgi:hypothetical protein
VSRAISNPYINYFSCFILYLIRVYLANRKHQIGHVIYLQYFELGVALTVSLVPLFLLINNVFPQSLEMFLRSLEFSLQVVILLIVR